MTWEEALKAMLDGKKVEHKYFVSGEYFEMRNGRVFAEDGCPMDGWFDGSAWQMTGWSIV